MPKSISEIAKQPLELLDKLQAKIGAWLCKTLGWHLMPAQTFTDRGSNTVGDCPRCGVQVVQTPEGNWATRRVGGNP
jgi:hypothetical protein